MVISNLGNNFLLIIGIFLQVEIIPFCWEILELTDKNASPVTRLNKMVIIKSQKLIRTGCLTWITILFCSSESCCVYNVFSTFGDQPYGKQLWCHEVILPPMVSVLCAKGLKAAGPISGGRLIGLGGGPDDRLKVGWCKMPLGRVPWSRTGDLWTLDDEAKGSPISA